MNQAEMSPFGCSLGSKQKRAKQKNTLKTRKRLQGLRPDSGNPHHMKNQSQIGKKPLTKGENAQRKKARRHKAKLPFSATRRRLKDAAADQEREAKLREMILFIERRGSAEFRLHLSNVITALAKMV